MTIKIGNRGWIKQSSLTGDWRAVTPAGVITRHPTSLAAMEALL